MCGEELKCNRQHTHSLESRYHAYAALWRAQEAAKPGLLTWREESTIMWEAMHEYDSEHPGKIS